MEEKENAQKKLQQWIFEHYDINYKYDNKEYHINLCYNRDNIEHAIIKNYIVNNESLTHFGMWDEAGYGKHDIHDESYYNIKWPPTPTLQNCKDNNIQVDLIFDLAIPHKGQIKCGIMLTDNRYQLINKMYDNYESVLDSYNNIDITVLFLDINWVLSQKEKPKFLIPHHILEYGY